MDIRKSLEIMRGLDQFVGQRQGISESRARLLNESEGEQISDQELQEEINKFQEEVTFAPAETFKPFAKSDNAIHWGGTLEGVLAWSFYVTMNRDKSNVSIQIAETAELSDHLIEVLNNLKFYYDKFYEYWSQEL